jgi:predicted nucleic acid-binding protein
MAGTAAREHEGNQPVKYLFDTNIISELQKTNCNSKVKNFTDKIPSEDIFICTVSIGELSYGIEKLPVGKKKQELSVWLYTVVPEWFSGRIISLDTDTMMEWGRIRARARRTMPVIDSLMAATAITHHMTLVTRNTKDFEDTEGIILINPWEL